MKHGNIQDFPGGVISEAKIEYLAHREVDNLGFVEDMRLRHPKLPKSRGCSEDLTTPRTRPRVPVAIVLDRADEEPAIVSTRVQEPGLGEFRRVDIQHSEVLKELPLWEALLIPRHILGWVVVKNMTSHFNVRMGVYWHVVIIAQSQRFGS